MEIPDDLCADVRQIIGNVQDVEILNACITCFALDGTAVGALQEYTTRSEIITGARIARAFTYLATRTYEGRPLTTGILVCSPPRCQEIFESDSDGSVREEYFVQFAEPVSPDWNDVEGIAKFAQLADGHNSILLGDTLGRIHGILDIEADDIRGISFWTGGYGLVTSKNREMALYFSWRFGEFAAAIHNGYEWGYGVPSSLDTIRRWFNNELLRAGQFEWARIHGEAKQEL